MATSILDLFVRISADSRGFSTGMGAAAKEINALGRSMEELGSRLSSIGMKLTASVSVPLAAVGAAALKMSGDLEQASVAFTTMLGSSDRARLHLEQLKQFALGTPFQFPDLVLASKRLQALGFTAAEVIPTLTAVGNATSALGSGALGIERITLALGQMQSKGKVSAQEMRQLAEAGIPAWQILADAISKTEGRVVTVAQVMKQAEHGFIEGTMAVETIVAGMQSRFGGLMERQSQTLLGVWEKFKERLTFILANIGDALAPMAKRILDTFTEISVAVEGLVIKFRQMPQWVQDATVSLVGLAAAAGPVLFVFGQLTSGIGTALKLFASLAPVVKGAGVAIAGAGVGATALASSLTVLGAAVVAVGVAFTAWKIGSILIDLGKFVLELPSVTEKIDSLTKSLKSLASLLDEIPGFKKIRVEIEQVIKSAGQNVEGSLIALKNSGAILGALNPLSFLESALSSDFKDFGAKEAASLKKNFVSASMDMIEAYNKWKAVTQANMMAVEDSAKESAKKINEAFAKAFSLLGMRDVARESAELKAAFDLLVRSGKLGIDGLAAAKTALIQKLRELANAVPGVTEAYKALGKAQDTFVSTIAAIQKALDPQVQTYERTTSALEKLQKQFTDGWHIDLVSAQLETLNIALDDMYQTSVKMAEVDPTAAARGGILETSRIMRDIGLKSTVDLRIEANRLGDQYMRLVELQKAGAATANDVAAAYKKWHEAELAAAGISIKAAKDQSTSLKEVSTILTNLHQDLARLIVNWKGWGDTAVAISKRIGEAIVADIIKNLILTEERMKAITKGLDTVLSKIPGLGKVFGGATDAATDAAASAAGQAAGKAAGGVVGSTASASVGTGVASAAGSTIGSILGSSITGNLAAIADAIISFGQWLQGRRMEQDIGRIEVTSREIKAELMNLRNDSWAREGHLMTKLDDIWASINRIKDVLWFGKINVHVASSTKAGSAEEILDPLDTEWAESQQELVDANKADLEFLEDLSKQRENSARTIKALDESLSAVIDSTDETSKSLKNLSVAVSDIGRTTTQSGGRAQAELALLQSATDRNAAAEEFWAERRQTWTGRDPVTGAPVPTGEEALADFSAALRDSRALTFGPKDPFGAFDAAGLREEAIASYLANRAPFQEGEIELPGFRRGDPGSRTTDPLVAEEAWERAFARWDFEEGRISMEEMAKTQAQITDKYQAILREKFLREGHTGMTKAGEELFNHMRAASQEMRLNAQSVRGLNAQINTLRQQAFRTGQDTQAEIRQLIIDSGLAGMVDPQVGGSMKNVDALGNQIAAAIKPMMLSVEEIKSLKDQFEAQLKAFWLGQGPSPDRNAFAAAGLPSNQMQAGLRPGTSAMHSWNRQLQEFYETVGVQFRDGKITGDQYRAAWAQLQSTRPGGFLSDQNGFLIPTSTIMGQGPFSGLMLPQDQVWKYLRDTTFAHLNTGTGGVSRPGGGAPIAQVSVTAVTPGSRATRDALVQAMQEANIRLR